MTPKSAAGRPSTTNSHCQPAKPPKPFIYFKIPPQSGQAMTLTIVVADMITLIGELTGLAASDAYTLCSLAADLRVTQTVDGNKGIHCVIRKDRLPDRGALTQARCA